MNSAVMRSRCALILLLTAFACFNAPSARAADAPKSIAVTVRQVNPAGDTKSVTCLQDTKCVLTIALAESNPSQKEDVTVQIEFSPGSLLLEFQTPRGYLYAGETQSEATDNNYEVIWHRALDDDAKLTENITLYLPVVAQPILAPILNVAEESAKNKTHPAVATVELTTQASP